jgi:hypothetical protein
MLYIIFLYININKICNMNIEIHYEKYSFIQYIIQNIFLLEIFTFVSKSAISVKSLKYNLYRIFFFLNFLEVLVVFPNI